MKENTHNADVNKYGGHTLSDTNLTPDGRFRTLVGLLLSAQTKDPITAGACCRLNNFLPLTTVTPELQQEIRNYKINDFKKQEVKKLNLTVQNVKKSSLNALEVLIYPYLKAIADKIEDVPSEYEDLIKLPGIGMKMAKLILKIAYNKIVGIACDTHVFRISHRLGLSDGKNPDQVSKQLEKRVNRRFLLDMDKPYVKPIHPFVINVKQLNIAMRSIKTSSRNEFRFKRMIVSPSILSADFATLADECKLVLEQGADWLHIDVMDGHFVPNITIGSCVVKSLRKHLQTAFLDTHLMVSEPQKWIESFAKAGSDLFTFHIEVCQNEQECLDIINQIHKNNMKAGISIKPKTQQDQLTDKILQSVDVVLIMSVEPGFGGQKYMPDCAEKGKILRERLNKLNSKALIEIDGGINDKTVIHAKECMIDVVVAGSYVFSGDYKEKIQSLKI